MNALVYVNIEQGAFIKGKNKVKRNEKWKNKLGGFSYSKNMANFEAFR